MPTFDFVETGQILLIIFFAALVVQLAYYFVVFARLAFYKDRFPGAAKESVSVIICAKNEAENLLKNLPLILEQDYKYFEVVVVNDNSSDDTEDVLRAFKEQHANFKMVQVTEPRGFWGGKKYALTLGIKAAKNDLLVFTDADCRPRSEKWLSGMVNAFDEDTEIVLGYGAYEKRKGFLNKLIRFDTFMIALQYFSFALAGRPYMGVGRNMAYRKKLFFRNKGFSSHQQLLSGDDDLFVNETGNRKNTRIITCSESHTVSIPETSFSSWWKQKRRHLTTGSSYKRADRFLLGLQLITQLVLMVLLVVLLVWKVYVYWILGGFFLRVLIQMFIFKKSMQQLKEQDLIIFAPVLEIVLMIIYPILAVSNLLFRPNKWMK